MFVTVLEFLSEKANVIHGDISVNNILINHVWNGLLEDSPSQLRILASSINTSIDGSCADDRNDDDSAPKLGLQSTHDPVLPLAPAHVDVSYDGTLESIEAAGMLIDCDLMRLKDDERHQISVHISSMILTSALTHYS